MHRRGGDGLRLLMTPAELLDAHAADAVCDLQTIGRTSGRRRTIEMWFATDGERIYLLAGGRDDAHWIRNLRAEPRVRVRIGGQTVQGTARVIEGHARDPLARRLLATKYQGWTEGDPLSSWAEGSLPVEVSISG
ncbi:MAG: nitroreductase family deazaflavin-dependent oxidoreductase [Chloroflexi bacterium]|nr:nitroreductase family deazaflavin-dependent oxidoreductase [Chloroflexota bacterium]